MTDDGGPLYYAVAEGDDYRRVLAMTDEREKKERVYTGNIRWCHRRICWVFEFDTWHESMDELLIGRHDCRVIVEDEP